MITDAPPPAQHTNRRTTRSRDSRSPDIRHLCTDREAMMITRLSRDPSTAPLLSPQAGLPQRRVAMPPCRHDLSCKRLHATVRLSRHQAFAHRSRYDEGHANVSGSQHRSVAFIRARQFTMPLCRHNATSSSCKHRSRDCTLA
jgi:hypothetical protein